MPLAELSVFATDLRPTRVHVIHQVQNVSKNYSDQAEVLPRPRWRSNEWNASEVPQNARLRRAAMEHMIEHHADELEGQLQTVVVHHWTENRERLQERQRRDLEYQQHLLSLRERVLREIGLQANSSVGTPEPAALRNQHAKSTVNSKSHSSTTSTPSTMNEFNSGVGNASLHRRRPSLKRNVTTGHSQSQHGHVGTVPTSRERQRSRRQKRHYDSHSLDSAPFDNVGGLEIVGLKQKRYDVDIDGNVVPDTWSHYLFYTHLTKTVIFYFTFIVFTWAFWFTCGLLKIYACSKKQNSRATPTDDCCSKVHAFVCCLGGEYKNVKRQEDRQQIP